MGFRDLLERFRRPEHTGSNRCTPCTILNVGVAIGLALAAAAVALSTSGRSAATAIGAVIAALSGVTIYLRGYLVPGTPRLTKTYGPDWLLKRFGKQTTGVDDGADVDLALKGVAARSNTDDERESDVTGDETAE
ncbi:hypothetical protein [Halostagnicola bangensis]